MKIEEIKIDPNGEQVSIWITAERYPQSIAGIVWRYLSDQSPDGKAGEFSSKIAEVPLGVPAGILNRFFQVEGAVLNQNDNPPTPYQVVVTVKQGANVLSNAVPEDGGSGQISDEDQPFYYALKLI